MNPLSLIVGCLFLLNLVGIVLVGLLLASLPSTSLEKLVSAVVERIRNGPDPKRWRR